MNCPICNSEKTVVLCELNALQFLTNEESFPFVLELCECCRFIYQASAYNEEYKELSSKVYEEFYKNDQFDFPIINSDNLKAIEMIIKHISTTADINALEIGSNRGDLLYLLKQKRKNVNILGLEPARFENLTVPTINTFFYRDLFSSKFDIIIMQHVLEHMVYPKNIIDDIDDLLTEDGILYIEVPSVINFLKYKLDDFELEHTNYFTIQSLKKLLYNFDLVDCQKDFFLKTIWKKSKGIDNMYYDEQLDLRAEFDVLQNNKMLFSKQVVEYSKDPSKKIIFYGNGYYFRFVYRGLQDEINSSSCYYYDDSFIEDKEDFFGLPRASTFDKHCVVVICSNNLNSQNAIENKLELYKGLTIIRPWNKIRIV